MNHRLLLWLIVLAVLVLIAGGCGGGSGDAGTAVAPPGPGSEMEAASAPGAPAPAAPAAPGGAPPMPTADAAAPPMPAAPTAPDAAMASPGAMPGAAPAAAPTAAPATGAVSSASLTEDEQVLAFHELKLASAITTSTEKCTEQLAGKSTPRTFKVLKFKYQLRNGRVLDVELPEEYKNEKLARGDWDGLFCAYATPTEQQSQQDELDRMKPHFEAISNLPVLDY